MPSEGAVAPFTFWEEIHMLALSLAFFRVSFVFSLPWFSGLILGSGWVQVFWVLRALWVPCYAAMWACAPIGVAWVGALSGMVMHGRHQWNWATHRTIYFCQAG
jgi:hypothetical protein